MMGAVINKLYLSGQRTEERIMKSSSRVFIVSALALLFAPLIVPAQWSKKPYTEWSEKEALKLLDDSPWSQKQSFTDTSKNFSVSRGQTTIADVITVNFHIRFFTARPVRQAISRYTESQQKGKLSDQMAARLKALATA